jgi:SAM-dependent methyltransferase
MRDERSIQVPQSSWFPYTLAGAFRPTVLDRLVHGLRRRWTRERRRRKVGRAYDMALEIARIIPHGSQVLDVGCGNGYIAHHLSAILGTSVVGIDVGTSTEAAIEYRRFDGIHFPRSSDSVDVVLLCYVLHHCQDVHAVLGEVRRVLRPGGTVIIYEDIPERWWDKGVCWIHNRQWKNRTGPCTFRNNAEWICLFESGGFEAVSCRRLSRARNLAHPIRRELYLLKKINLLEDTLPKSFQTRF